MENQLSGGERERAFGDCGSFILPSDTFLCCARLSDRNFSLNSELELCVRLSFWYRGSLLFSSSFFFFDSLQTDRTRIIYELHLEALPITRSRIMLSFSFSSVNDMSNATTPLDDDVDEYLFSAEMSRRLVDDKLIRQKSSFVFEISESGLRTLGNEEQIVFLIIFMVITLVSLSGNLLTIFVLITR